MAVLGREALARAIKYALVDVPELGGEVRLRSLSSARIAEMGDLFVGADQKNTGQMFNIGARLLVECWVDEDGALVLTADDIPAVLEFTPGVLNKLAGKLMDLNGLGDNAIENAKKNLAKTRNGGSGSA